MRGPTAAGMPEERGGRRGCGHGTAHNHRTAVAVGVEEVLGLSAELARADALLDDAEFFAPFAAHFDPV